VILILADDQGYGDMSCNGNPYIQTPEMDKLHNEGVHFNDFHVDPTSAPTRSALMTGRYSARVGVWLTYGSRNHLRRNEKTMADAFHENGYKTAIFGKWHLGENYPFRPTDRGFDLALIHGGGVVGETPDFWNNNYYDDIYFRNGVPEQETGFCTDVWFKEALHFIDKNKNNPFFVYLPTNAAHAPFFSTKEYAAPYKDSKRKGFYGLINSIDVNIGRLRAYLKANNLDKNTILVYLNDNGTSGGVSLTPLPGGDTRNGWTKEGYNAGMRGRKTSRFEGGHRAACYMLWPKGNITGGRKIDGVTAHIDLLPTLAELCGLNFNDHLPFDGISYAKQLQDKAKNKNKERIVVVHDQGRFGSPIGDAPLIKYKDYSVMQNQWRLVEKDKDSEKELYDLTNDPGERKNIAFKYPKKVKELSEAYEKWWDSVYEHATEYCPFVINPEKLKTTLISTQNLFGGEVVYSQRNVKQGVITNGYAIIDVEKPGKYEISLSRWPREAHCAISKGLPAHALNEHIIKEMMRIGKIQGKTLTITQARLKVKDFDGTQVVNPLDQKKTFTLNLSEGEQKIQAWFTQKDGTTLSPYYIYIEPAEE